MGDFNLCLDQIVLDIKTSIGHNEIIDCALIVIKSTDYRITVQETMAIKGCAKFFSNFSPANVYLVITHCDEQMPTDEFISEKLQAFAKYGPLAVPPENVVKFDNTAKTLLPMLEKMQNSNMKFVPDIEKKAAEVAMELEGDFKKQDAAYGTSNGAEFAALVELLKDSQRNNEGARE